MNNSRRKRGQAERELDKLLPQQVGVGLESVLLTRQHRHKLKHHHQAPKMATQQSGISIRAAVREIRRSAKTVTLLAAPYMPIAIGDSLALSLYRRV